DAERARLDLHLRGESLELDLAHDAAEAVSRGELVPVVAAAQPLDLAQGHEPPIGVVACRADAALAIPAPERVEADPQPPSGFSRREHLPRHRLGKPTSAAAVAHGAGGRLRRDARVDEP